MKKLLFSVVFLSLISSQTIIAEDTCSVIGFHPQGTHEYMGPTWCNSISFKNIQVYGPLYADESHITGLTEVNGPIKLTHSQLDKVTIKNTHTPQEVILTTSSEVTGNITFEGPSGSVVVDSNSHFYGKVINGIVINK